MSTFTKRKRNMKIELECITDLEQFIEEIKKSEYIWNTECKQHANRALISTRWREIGDLFGVTATTAKLKWKNLRDIFRRECRNHLDATNPEEYKGKWKYFEDLWFLRKTMHITPRNSELDPELVYEDKEDANSNCDNMILFKTELSDDNDREIYFETEERLEDDFDVITPKKKIKYTSRNKEEDYDLMFLKSLLPYFKNFSPKRKLVVRTKIQDLILNELEGQQSTESSKMDQSI